MWFFLQRLTRPNWALLPCSYVDQPSPKGSRTEVPRGTQSWRQEAQGAAEGVAACRLRFTVPKPRSAAELYSDGRVSISVSYKNTNPSQTVLIFWRRVCKCVASEARPVGVWQLPERALHGWSSKGFGSEADE